MDGDWPKKYSSKKELKILAVAFAENNKIYSEHIGRFLLEVDRLKSHGKFSDDQILVYAYHNVLNSETMDYKPWVERLITNMDTNS